MVKKKIDTDAEKGQVEEDKVVKSLIDSIEEEELTGEKFKRWEADEARSALFEQEEKRPLLSVIGLVIGLLSWIILFILPSGEEHIVKQICLMLAIGAGAFVLSFFGRRQAYYMSVIGMLVSGGLILFLLIALIAFYVTK